MKRYKKKVKIFYILICASVLLLSTNILAVQQNLININKIDERTLKTIIVPDDYTTISEALINAVDGDTIFVKPGRYMENIVINKMITLEGAAWEHVIIDGDQKGNVIKITASGVTIKGFTIINSSDSSAGIDINMNHFNIITMNIIQSNYYGIKLYSSNGNNITHNIISNNLYNGITSEASHSNFINDNDLSNNGISGLYFHYTSTFNEAKYNIVNENGLDQDASFYKQSIAGGIVIDTACRSNLILSNEIESNQIGVNSEGNNENNIIYYNSFIDNVEGNARDTSQNEWSRQGFGNFWSDYSGIDEDGDGIGDIPYTIAGGDNEDEYPLIDSAIPEPPEIEAPEKWNIDDGDVEFKFRSLDQNYQEVWFEIIWGDASDPEVEGPTNPFTGITKKHGFELELRYSVKAKTVAITKTGETVKSSWAEHKIILPKLEQSSKEKNENQIYSSNKPIFFSEIIEKISRFFDKTSNSLNPKHTMDQPFSQIPIELSIVNSVHFFDITLDKHVFLKKPFFPIKHIRED